MGGAGRWVGLSIAPRCVLSAASLIDFARVGLSSSCCSKLGHTPQVTELRRAALACVFSRWQGCLPRWHWSLETAGRETTFTLFRQPVCKAQGALLLSSEHAGSLLLPALDTMELEAFESR